VIPDNNVVVLDDGNKGSLGHFLIPAIFDLRAWLGINKEEETGSRNGRIHFSSYCQRKLKNQSPRFRLRALVSGKYH